MTAEIIPLRKLKTISVWFDEEGWNVGMGTLHKVFWKRRHASGFIDLLLSKNFAQVEVIGEVPEE
jgi:hypothetical protein